MPEVRDVKSAAAGQWGDLLVRLGGIPADILDGKNHPCPKCGGTDRFRYIDADAGACYCNQCFNSKNGDGIAAIWWLTGGSFHDTLVKLGRELGLCNGEFIERDLVDEMAYRKGITADSLAAYGATNDMRDQLKVCRVPMHDADMNVVGYLDLAPEPEGFDKGMTVKGCHHGLFVAVQPKPGDTVAVVEGPKDAAALHAMGILAVGLPTNKMAADFARFFRDTNVVIVPDRDKAGISGAQETARRLFGVAASVAIAELPAEYSETGGADVRDVLREHDGERKVRDAIKHAKPWGQNEKAKPRFIAVTCAELAGGNYTVEYAIEGVLVFDQPDFIGGPPKSLKTSIGWDMAIAVATGRDFLNRFKVLRTGKVAYFTGEGGLGFSQDLGFRVCAAKGIRLEDVDMVVCDRLPRLDNFEEMAEIGEFITKHGIDVAFFDPIYLAMSGADASNVLAMGERLGAVNRVCMEAGVTPVLIHHLKRSRADLYAPGELTDLSFSGFAEFAGQWQLVTRRGRYVPTQFARHELWLSIGGRNGHGGLYGLDVEEGTTGSEMGRYWFAQVLNPDDLQRNEKAAVEARRDAKEAEQLDADCKRLVRAMGKYPEGETESALRRSAGMSGTRFQLAIDELVGNGHAVECGITKPNRKTPYPAYRLLTE